MFNYEQYCKMCEEKNIENPYKAEIDFNRAYGIARESEISLFQVKKKPQPKIKAGFEDMNKPKRERKCIKKKKKPLTEEQRKRKNEAERIRRAKKRRESGNFLERVSMVNMTDEEKRAHRAKLARIRRARAKENGTYIEPERTPEQIEQRRKYFRDYHQRMKNNPEYKAKRLASHRRYDQTRERRMSRDIEILSA